MEGLIIKVKSSIFNVFTTLNKDDILVYNTLTQSSICVKDPLLVKIKNNPNELDEECKEYLLKNKLLVSDSFDEKEYLLSKFREKNKLQDKLDLIICTTTLCNMECVYCYEENIFKDKLNIQTIVSIAKWIENIIKNKKLKILSILLFGGEPLVAKTEAIMLMKEINCLCNKHNVMCYYGIATNGVLLEVNTVKELKELGLQVAQITLDGPEEVQNTRRKLKNSKNGFITIIDNIKQVVELLDVVIKFNIDKGNIDYVEEFLNVLELNHLKDKIQIKIEAIAKTPASKDNPNHYCNNFAFDPHDSELANAYFYTINMAVHRGFKVEKSTGHITPCMFSSESCLAIAPNGNIYKCLSAIGIDSFKVGNVKQHSFNNNYTNSLKFLQLVDSCFKKGCPYIPKCGAGCAYDSFCREGNAYICDCKYDFLHEYYLNKFKSLYNNKFGT